MVMAIDLHDGEAECTGFLIKRFQIVGLTHRRALLQPVAVRDDREPIQLVMRGSHQGLPVAAFLKFAVTDEYVGPSAGDVKLGRDRVADSDRQAMTEWPGIGLNSANVFAVRMAIELRQRLEKRCQFLHRQESKGGQGGVKGTGDMALGEDEPVAVGVIDGLWRDIENRAVQRSQNVDGGEIATNMAGTRVVDQLQILDADLPRRFGDVRDLFVAVGVWVEPVQDRHGDVLGSKGCHAVTSWVVRAIELSKTSWTSRCAASASWEAWADRRAATSSASRAPCSALRKRMAALAAVTLSSRNGN